MRIVTFLRDMRPWQKGEDAVVPDGMAEKLLSAGDAENSRPFPPPDVEPAVSVGKPTPVSPFRPKRYLTRGKS